MKPHHVLPTGKANARHQPFKKELKNLQTHQILAPVGTDEMVEWHNSFVIVPKPNGTVSMCLHTTGHNQVPVRPVHRGPTFNGILPKLTNVLHDLNRCKLRLP